MYDNSIGHLRSRWDQLADQSERGAISLETVIIAAALLTIALALVAVIAAAVTSRSGGLF